MELLKFLIEHAVGQCGRDRTYTIRFGGSTPIVDVYDGDTRLREYWTASGIIHENKFQ